ncbi:shikimate kinase [Allopusillimonas soli]|uniref:Shikimate kinase n=1 Tax=Allopusillimonas soli TaxID=659016 RepID=A0A853FBB1_9BURK|nr:shikimate kinase [Allopusillimonas soli]TEA74747.1 shikimate kinase [Allopusillimonas soli]
MNQSLPAAPDLQTADSAGAAEAASTAPVFLVGMMGAGKTTIGRHLARMLNRQFIDLDHELEARCGVRVALIFDIEGEEGFRRRETALLDECSRRQGIILATGGGAVLAEENRRMLSERGLVLYLRATAEELFRRVARDRSRPLLQTPDPQARIRALLDQREPLYESIARLTVDTGSAHVMQLARDLLPRLRHYEQQEKPQ